MAISKGDSVMFYIITTWVLSVGATLVIYIYIFSFFSWWFNVGLVLLGVCLSLATFCIVYLEWFKGIKHYDQEYPAIPPITTAAFIAASCRWSSWKDASHLKLSVWYLIIVAVFFFFSLAALTLRSGQCGPSSLHSSSLLSLWVWSC